MKKITQIVKSIAVEIFIIFILIFIINNYFINDKVRIKGDGVYYYDFLPSLFIHHDFVRIGRPIQQDSAFYNRINTLPLYLDYGTGYRVNKCPSGTAVCQLPFFIIAALTTHCEGNFNDGYQLPFQRAVYFAAIFYLFLTIILLRKILELYDVKKFAIIWSQLLLVLGTSVTNYTNYDPGYSHIYSLFAITAFIFFGRSYFVKRNLKHFIYACIFLGLTLVIRQVNLLVLLFIPFMAGSAENLKSGFALLFKHYKTLLIGILLFLAICFIQCLSWYLQTGSFFIYSYPGETFNFTEPQIINVLFSYKKGLFVYTPVLFFSLFGIVWLMIKRKFYLAITWFSFFAILTYIISSWWSWWYGCSYGMRPYIDFYAIFFIPFAMMLDGMNNKLRIVIVVLSFLTIPLNIIQTYQYKNYILHWINMDKEKYWKVFLKTSEKYRLLIWKQDYNPGYYNTIKEINLGDTIVKKNTDLLIFKIKNIDIPGFDKVNMIRVSFENEYREKNDALVIMHVDDTSFSHTYYWEGVSIIRFAGKNFGEWQPGYYNFEFTPLTDTTEKIIGLEVKSENMDTRMKNIRLKFLSLKPNIKIWK